MAKTHCIVQAALIRLRLLFFHYSYSGVQFNKEREKKLSWNVSLGKAVEKEQIASN